MYCKQCGYPLRDLADARCPECGRGFDADDAATYSPYDVGARRRRRRMWWGIALFVLIVVGVLLAPRTLVRGKMTYRCKVCNHVTRIQRLEPRPPSWVPFRYPGWTWRDDEPCHPESCETHDMGFVMRSPGGVLTARGDADTSLLNGVPADIEHSRDVLRMITAPGFNSVTCASVPR